MGSSDSDTYDVIICGGGLAGLTLARQLRLRLPELSVALIDKCRRPLPFAAHKVGESTVEIAGHYFGKILQLEDYFKSAQLRKFDLRYYFGDPAGPFALRPELGARVISPNPTYQIDRGLLENDLRNMAADWDVALLEGRRVDDIVLNQQDELHKVVLSEDDGRKQTTLRGRWIVDALGRRRLLQSKLKLQQPSGHSGSAAWWRVSGRVDVSDFVPASDKAWHNRVAENRYHSTNHLMGRGYWVWLIPLASGATSIGIVTDEAMHPFSTYGTDYAQSLEWLKRNEPLLHGKVKDRAPLDFLGLRNFSYHSKQVFSAQRWSCVGVAGVFSDAFYSPGSDFIAIGNTITVSLIEGDFRGELSSSLVDLYNHFYLDLLSTSSYHTYTGTYATFGHSLIYPLKLLWDATFYWGIWAQLFFQRVLEDPEALAEACPLIERYSQLYARMQKLFIEWSDKAPPANRAGFTDVVASWPLLAMLSIDLQTKRTPAECLVAIRENLERIEELAQAIFFRAADECCPEKASSLPGWVNAWAIGLDSEIWERDGLNRPQTAPRDLAPMIEHVQIIGGRLNWRQRFRLAAWAVFFRAFRGRLCYWVTRAAISAFLRGKSGLRTRRFMFRRLFAPSWSGVRRHSSEAADFHASPPGQSDL